MSLTSINLWAINLWAVVGLLVGLVILLILVSYLRWRREQVMAEEQPEAKSPPEALLEDLEDTGKGERYECSRAHTVLGRSAGEDPAFNYIVLESKTVSRSHAVIECVNSKVWVIDQGSANGTFINDKRVKERVMLQDGDILRLYKYKLRVHIPAVEQDSDQTTLADGAEAMVEGTVVMGREFVELDAPPEETPEAGAQKKISLDNFISNDGIE